MASKKTENDTGSTDSQITILTKRIRSINEHLKTNSKDQLFIDRTELGKEVFKKNGNIKAIEKILHPLIHQQEKKFGVSI